MPDLIATIIGSPEFAAFILAAFATTVGAVVTWLGVQFRKRILRSLSAADLALLRSIAVIAVQYAEQRFKDAGGPVKLEEAMNVADTMLVGYGIRVNTSQLRAIVEAAVFTETLKLALPATLPVEAE